MRVKPIVLPDFLMVDGVPCYFDPLIIDPVPKTLTDAYLSELSYITRRAFIPKLVEQFERNPLLSAFIRNATTS